MLNQLIESNSHLNDNARRGGFLLSTFVVVCAIFFSGILWSLFAKDLKMGADDFEISALIAPVPMPDNAPPQPEPKQVKQERAATETLRQTNTLRVDESQNAPDKISVTPNIQKARPRGDFKLSNLPEVEGESSNATPFERGGGTGIGIGESVEPSANEIKKSVAPPPPVIAKKENMKPLTDRKVSLGVINGRAKNLVIPQYPQLARTIRATGAVNVQVTIDEQGNVVAANAVSGHPMLRQAAETAARASKFNPTLLSNQPVKATGLIIYNFSAQ